MNFLEQLNTTNSQQNQQTYGYVLTVPILELEGEYTLIPDKDLTITSNCKTIIKCHKITIIANNTLCFTNINFEAQISICNSSNVRFSDCSIVNTKIEKESLSISNVQSISLSNVVITNTKKHHIIMITLNSNVTADNLNLNDSKESIISCKNESTLYIKNSILSNAKGNAIYISNNSKLKIKNCNILNTDYPAIYIDNSIAEIENNIIQNSKQNGISINNSKDIKIIGNKLSNIDASSISFINSTGLIHQNRIFEIKGNGVFVDQNSDVKISENEINSDYPGIAILMNSKAIISKNKIMKATYNGISIRMALFVIIEECQLTDINDCGISISDTENCIVRNNNITNCNRSAIESNNQSKVNVIGNKIVNIQGYAFLVYTSAFVHAENNIIDNIGKALIKLIFNGGGEFVNNDVKNCAVLKEGQTSSHYFISSNGNLNNITNIESRKSNNVLFDDVKILDENIMCIKCNKNKRDSVLLDCGHRVYCIECANNALINHEDCPLCNFPLVNVIKMPPSLSENKCMICSEKESNCIIIPCGHMPKRICKKCLMRWYINTKRCPVCIKEPSSFKIINE